MRDPHKTRSQLPFKLIMHYSGKRLRQYIWLSYIYANTTMKMTGEDYDDKADGDDKCI